MPFELLETLRLQEGRYRHADAHLQRMARAAAHFGWRWPQADVQQALGTLAAAHALGAWRARLLLDARGAVCARAHGLTDVAPPLRVRLAAAPLACPDADFIRFKTTRREHYDAFAPTDPEIFDTLLWNDKCELTEFTRGNVVLRIEGRWLTPPLHCGLLDGVGRGHALREGRATVERLGGDHEHASANFRYVDLPTPFQAAHIVVAARC